jgi:hypothetical protein
VKIKQQAASSKEKQSKNDNKSSPMTLPKKPDLDRILKFCATTSKSAPSPPLRRREVYCLSSFTRRAEQWYKEDAGRQLTQRSREAAAVGRRRQPSRAAKGTFEPGDYVLREDEVNSLLCPPAAIPQAPDSKGNGHKTKAHETRRLPKPDEDEDAERPRGEQPDPAEAQSPEARFNNFRARLGRALHTKDQELRAQHDRDGGVRHTCAVGGGMWDCVDEEYCGHGLVDRCVRWVPKAKAHLRPRVRFEMEGFFSSSGGGGGGGGSNNNHYGIISSSIDNNNSPARLAELKKGRAAALKAETMRRMADIEARLESAGGAAAAEAQMLESPTLGRWPAGSQGFPREDAGAQRVELAGLAFAVDVCIRETRVLML